MGLEVTGSVVLRTTSRSLDAVQAKLFFEDPSKRLIRVDGFVGMMDLQRLRIDLVHRDVNVLVLGSNLTWRPSW